MKGTGRERQVRSQRDGSLQRVLASLTPVNVRRTGGIKWTGAE